MKRFLLLLTILLLISCAPKRKMVYTTYAPIVRNWSVGRGVGINGPKDAITYASQIQMVKPDWIRADLLWKNVEATKGEYHWVSFDPYYQALLDTKAELIVILKMAPSWARTDPRECGRIDPQYIKDFTAFAKAAQLRYPKIRYWEVWNEMDSAWGEGDYYGCWGNNSEPYYGGAYYASVINPVRIAILQANPNAKVYFGGLMLVMNTNQKLYFEGAVGAGAKFDGVSFHCYSYCSTGIESPVGRVDYLRKIMAKYGIDKPLLLTETSLLYTTAGLKCEALQALYVDFIYAETYHLGLQGFIWYALPDTGWNHSSLMERYQSGSGIGERLKLSFFRMVVLQ